MAFSGMNYLAVIVAAAAAWLFGGAWYGVFGTRWIAATGKTKEELMPGGKPEALPLIIAFAAEIIMAYLLAGLIGHLGEPTVRTGMISGAFIWFGFVITTMTVNNIYARLDRRLLLIDGGHWLGVLLIMGAVIGAMGF